MTARKLNAARTAAQTIRLSRLRPAAWGALAALAWAGPAASQQPDTPGGLGAIDGIAVGHHTLEGGRTGCTVVLTTKGATAGVDVRGGAPGTRETALLDPANSVRRVHAVVFSGGSAFGLDAASGVVRWLEEHEIGYEVGSHLVPIVTGAILFDLSVAGPGNRPGPDCGYAAAERAARSAGPPGPTDIFVKMEGNVGAGAGASIGKLLGLDAAMKGGVGTKVFVREDGLAVGALVAVNAVGDVVDPATGQVVAGARRGDGLADARKLLHSGWLRGTSPVERPGENTTLAVVGTNASLTQAQATRVARMAHDGIARAIYPAHTPADGDIVFVLATGLHTAGGGDSAPAATSGQDIGLIGALAADAVAAAILRAVCAAEPLAGLPSATEAGACPK